MKKCKHTRRTVGDGKPYTGCVAKPPYTDCNQAAHGGESYVVSCDECHATRKVNTNGPHSEVGVWGD